MKELSKENFNEFIGKPSLLIISKEEKELNLFKSLENDKLLFFNCDTLNKYGENVLYNLGFNTKEIKGPIVLINDFNKKDQASSKKYLFTDEFNKGNLKKFIDSYIDGTLKVYIKSGIRPKNDLDIKNPGITIVTANSFDEIVLDKNTDVFLDVWADWCTPCVKLAPYVAIVAEVLKDVDGIKICKMNADENDYNPKYLSETYLPVLKLFKSNDKDNQVYWKPKNLSAVELLKFIHDNGTKKFDLMKLTIICAKKEEFLNLINDSKVIIGEYKNYELLINNEKVGKIENAKLFDEKIEKLIKSLELKDKNKINEDYDQLEALFKSSFPQISKLAKKAIEIVKLRELKYVKELKTYEEFDKIINNSKDLVIVDFSATWCGPCQAIAPYYAELSETFKNVVFVKIDVDELENLPIKYKVEGYPTFKLFKSSKVIDTLVGADREELLSIIKKHK